MKPLIFLPIIFDEGAASMNAVIHIDGHFAFQWRTYRGMFMRDPEDEFYFTKKGGQTIQLQRFGNTMSMYVAHWGEPLQFVGSHEMPEMKDEVLAGIFICSHDSDKVVDAKVWNVRIDKPVPGDYQPMKTIQRYLKPMTAVLSSRLETINVADGKRTIIHESATRFESPGWTPDGKHLLYNESGSVYTIPVTGGAPEPASSTPEKTTAAAHPTSHPRYRKVILRLIPTAGGAPRVIAFLYGGEGTINANPWSPDSKTIAFVSNAEKTESSTNQ